MKKKEKLLIIFFVLLENIKLNFKPITIMLLAETFISTYTFFVFINNNKPYIEYILIGLDCYQPLNPVPLASLKPFDEKLQNSIFFENVRVDLDKSLVKDDFEWIASSENTNKLIPSKYLEQQLYSCSFERALEIYKLQKFKPKSKIEESYRIVNESNDVPNFDFEFDEPNRWIEEVEKLILRYTDDVDKYGRQVLAFLLRTPCDRWYV